MHGWNGEWQRTQEVFQRVKSYEYLDTRTNLGLLPGYENVDVLISYMIDVCVRAYTQLVEAKILMQDNNY